MYPVILDIVYLHSTHPHAKEPAWLPPTAASCPVPVRPDASPPQHELPRSGLWDATKPSWSASASCTRVYGVLVVFRRAGPASSLPGAHQARVTAQRTPIRAPTHQASRLGAMCGAPFRCRRIHHIPALISISGPVALGATRSLGALDAEVVLCHPAPAATSRL